MKKLLLASAASALVAAASANAMYDLNPYVGVEGGWVKANDVKPYKTDSTKLKSDNAATFGAVVGSHMDMFRAELAYNYYMDPGYAKTVNKVKHKLKLKDAHSLMLRGAAEMPVMDMVSVYAEAGVGASMLKHTSAKGEVVTGKSPQQINFAYSLGAGVTTAVADNIHLNVGYRFTDLGKTAGKEKMNSVKTPVKRNAVQMHSVVAGVRFAM